MITARGGNTDLTADVAVIGGGPAGIAAATRMAESGRRVVLLDEGSEVGGQIWRHSAGGRVPREGRRWMERLSRSGGIILPGTSVVDAHGAGDGSPFVVTGERASAACRVTAGAVVLATGARERFLPFPGWTLPGVYGVGGAQALLKSGTSFAGKRVVIAGSGPLLLPVAAALARGGARVLVVAEQANARAVAGFGLGLWQRPAALVQAAMYRAAFLGTRYATGTWVTGARGAGVLDAVTLTNGRATRVIACDVLCSAHGLVPNVEMAKLLGCAISHGTVSVDERQETTRPGVYCAGEPTGIGGVDLAIVEGELAGAAVVGSSIGVEALRERRRGLQKLAARMERVFTPRDELRDVVTLDTIVCRCEDVARGALQPDWSARQAKLYTRAGMGACQGRVCGASLEFLFGWSPDSVRFPCEPALLSTVLAGSSAFSDDSRHPGA